jgi:peptide alpha-N-acetyltransferase
LNDAIIQKKVLTGYIGMLAVEIPYRRSGIGSALVHHVRHRMKEMGCTSIRLETEVSNKSAMRLYEDRFGFMRKELLVKYYLNWGDAYRVRLWLD